MSPVSADHDNVNAQSLAVRQILRRLDPDRYIVTMACENLPDVQFAAASHTRILELGRHGKAARLLGAYLTAADIIFLPTTFPGSAAWARAHRRLPRSPALVTQVLGDEVFVEPLPRALRRAVEANIREADVLLANSRRVAQLTQAFTGRPVDVIPEAVDTDRFHPAPGEAAGVVFAGSLIERKQPDAILDVAARHPGTSFRIVGDGPLRPRLAARIAAEGLRNVRLVGRLAPDLVAEELRRAAVFYFPSRSEGSPQVLLQAQACGTPVLCLDAYEPDQVAHGETGFVEADVDGMDRRLDQLLSDESQRAEMAAAGPEHVAQWSFDALQPRWADVFDAAVRR